MVFSISCLSIGISCVCLLPLQLISDFAELVLCNLYAVICGHCSPCSGWYHLANRVDRDLLSHLGTKGEVLSWCLCVQGTSNTLSGRWERCQSFDFTSGQTLKAGGAESMGPSQVYSLSTPYGHPKMLYSITLKNFKAFFMFEKQWLCIFLGYDILMYVHFVEWRSQANKKSIASYTNISLSFLHSLISILLFKRRRYYYW